MLIAEREELLALAEQWETWGGVWSEAARQLRRVLGRCEQDTGNGPLPAN